MSLQPYKDICDVFDGEHDAAYAQGVHRFVLLRTDRRRRVEFRELEPAVAVWSPHHYDVGSDIVEPDHAVDPRSLNEGLAVQFQTRFDVGSARGST